MEYRYGTSLGLCVELKATWDETYGGPSFPSVGSRPNKHGRYLQLSKSYAVTQYLLLQLTVLPKPWTTVSPY